MANIVNVTQALKKEISEYAIANKAERVNLSNYIRGKSFMQHSREPMPIAFAYKFSAMLRETEKKVYENDLIVGSFSGIYMKPLPQDEMNYYSKFKEMAGTRPWGMGVDHYASAYDRLLSMGVNGILDEIDMFSIKHAGDAKKVIFLKACRIAMEGFREWVLGFADATADEEIKQICRNIAYNPPVSFREALQLVWLAHSAYVCDGMYAMALGRLDQYLYPYYKKDIDAGIITDEEAQSLLENAFMKLHEYSSWRSSDDVVNICIGGITPEGENAVNELSWCILHAVGKCNIPGPNLSARINPKTPDDFVCECLKVIGTGLGYPALMNDIPNIAALRRHGYTQRDANNFCMVGCIENFLPGQQPPWQDGRFDTLKYLELLLNRGHDMLTGEMKGPDLGDPREIATMEEFVCAFEKQLRYGMEEYAFSVHTATGRGNPEYYVNPYMSCLAYGCIEKGLDIGNGGSRYPGAHGACIMGIASVSDSLAAIETCVYKNKTITMDRLIEALKANFEGYEAERQLLLDAPKYGNDIDDVDKYAVWLTNYAADVFDTMRLPDGGRIYTAMAANTSNIGSGKMCAASPDGRLAREPLSDAASPTYGRDKKGPTYTLKSIGKPDYSRVGTGSVVNQKYSPSMFKGEENLRRLCAMVRVYFEDGGQEVQVNAVSREMLMDAMEHPENYENLVVRVSGYSAYFTRCSRDVQMDILSRTEHS